MLYLIGQHPENARCHGNACTQSIPVNNELGGKLLIDEHTLRSELAEVCKRQYIPICVCHRE